ncbi:hypothetical protein C8J56DRAFT_1040612 [Mycena floridula]|nr:hypothetical protein C8J56DRAFT_1040612 [Mycena floridula]
MAAVTTNWTQLPAELVLLVAETSKIHDAVAISQVCRAFRLVSEERIFWITLLKAHFSSKAGPLACPAHEDLATLSLDCLKSLAFRAMKVKNSFQIAHDADSPVLHLQMVPGPIFQGPPDSHMLAFVPATDFLLFTNATGVSCWNMRTGIEVSFLQLGCLFLRSGEESDCDETGRFLVMAKRKQEDSSLPLHSVVIIAVDCRDIKCPLLSVAYRNDNTPEPDLMSLTTSMWSFIPFGPFPILCTVVNLKSGREHTVSTDISPDFVIMVDLRDDQLQILVLYEGSLQMHHVPREFLPFDDNLQPSTILASKDSLVWTEQGYYNHELIHIHSSLYIPEWQTVMSLMKSVQTEEPLCLSFVQKKAQQIKRWNIDLPENVEFIRPVCGLGTSSPWYTTLIALLPKDQPQLVYYLLRFDPENPTITAFQLVCFPCDVDLGGFTVDDFEFDEGKGELILIKEDCQAFRLSYL